MMNCLHILILISGGLNQYVFCGDNPVNCVDPLGLDANITVNGNNVTIEIPITFKGHGATKEVIEKFTKGIEDNWSGKFDEYCVTTKVTEGKANTITIPAGNGRAYVQGSNTGNWPAERPAWTAAHEVGHLMKHGDRYDTKTGKVNPGWEKNIMGEHGGKVEGRNIKEIIDQNKGKK